MMNETYMEKYIRKEDLIWNKAEANIPIVFWGCGNNAKIVRKLLKEKGIEPTVYCDNNTALHGQMIDGVEVISYAELRQRYHRYYILLTVAVEHAQPIYKQLMELGEKNEIIHVEKPFKVDDEMLEYDYFKSNIQEFEDIYECLEDDLSKEIFLENIRFRLCGNKMALLKYIDGDTFFDEKIIPVSDHYNYVDVGAYTGDTLLRFYAFVRGKYNKIYAVEPDLGNYTGLCELVKLGRLDNVTAFQKGGWDCTDILTFYSVKENNKRNFDSPNFFKSMDETMPNKWNIEEELFVAEQIEVDTVDNMLNGADCDIIKINALAADFQTLKGCTKTIQRNRPILVGEYGTRKENLTEMIQYMLAINPSYKLYLRQKMIFGDCKTVYYAIDEKYMK